MASKTHILLAGRNLARLVEISATLDPMHYAHVIAHTYAPLEYAAGPSSYRPDGGIIELAGTEDVMEFREMLQRNPSTCFVFLSDEMPPSAASARVAGNQAVFLDKKESALTISATLVALLYQRSRNARQA